MFGFFEATTFSLVGAFFFLGINTPLYWYFKILHLRQWPPPAKMIMRRLFTNWDNYDWFDRFFFRYMTFLVFIHLVVLLIMMFFMSFRIRWRQNIIDMKRFQSYSFFFWKGGLFTLLSTIHDKGGKLVWYSYLNDQYDSIFWLEDEESYRSEILPSLTPDWDSFVEYSFLVAINLATSWLTVASEVLDFDFTIFLDDVS